MLFGDTEKVLGDDYKAQRFQIWGVAKVPTPKEEDVPKGNGEAIEVP
jgi:hypothetical protein